MMLCRLMSALNYNKELPNPATRGITAMEMPLKWTPIRIEGNNIIAEVIEDDMEKEAFHCQFDIIGSHVRKRG